MYLIDLILGNSIVYNKFNFRKKQPCSFALTDDRFALEQTYRQINSRYEKKGMEKIEVIFHNVAENFS